jgi:hypothetical protein
MVVACFMIACGGEEQASGSAEQQGATDDRESGTRRLKEEGKPVESKPAEIPELVTDDLVRTKGGHALLLLPELNEGWSLVHKQSGGMRGIQLFRGTPSSFTGFITVLFLPVSPSGQTAEAAHEQFTNMMKGGMPGMSSSGEPKPFQGAGSLANTWSGTASSGVEERVWLGVVADGPASVGVMVRSAAQVMDSELMPMAKQLLDNLKVGSKVPHLPDRNPSVRLSGVWEYKSGLRIDWLIFDPRGYANSGPPADPTWLDLDVCLALGRRVRTYEVVNGEIVLEPYPADPNASTWRWKFEQKDKSLFIADQDHRRIDQAPVTISPGTWEYYESSSGGGSFSADRAVYEFAADGTYTYSGGFTFMHDQMAPDDPITPEWSVSGYAGNEPAKGKWRVDGHNLILSDGKRQVARLLYASQHSEKIIYIAGQRFVKMK